MSALGKEGTDSGGQGAWTKLPPHHLNPPAASLLQLRIYQLSPRCQDRRRTTAKPHSPSGCRHPCHWGHRLQT
jgi:hypothetical protein